MSSRPRLDVPRGYCPGCGRRPKVPPTCAGRRWWCATCLQARVATAARAAGIPPDSPPIRTTVTVTDHQGGTPPT